MLAGVPAAAVWLFATAVLIAAIVNSHCQKRRRTIVDYRLDAPQQAAFATLQDGVNALSRANATWRVPPDANSLVSARVGARPGSTQPRWIQSNIAISGIEAGSESFHFFPDQFLLWTRGMYAAISYADLKVHLQTVDLAETNRPPRDSITVGQTWRYARRDGGPDRRYRDNPAIPIVRYALLALKADQYEVGLLVSNLQQADVFATVLRAFAGVGLAKPTQPPNAPLRQPAPVAAAKPFAAPDRKPVERPESWRWVAEQDNVTVAGFRIPGRIYYGEGLPGVCGYGAEPALIDPSLPVAASSTGLDPQSIPYWPSYSQIEPEARHAYLAWHADGRAAADAPISFVFLYFYGIERRLLCDLGSRNSGSEEWASIVAEVRRLLSIYGANNSFRGYATRFLDIAEAVRMAPDINGPPPEAAAEAWELPAALKIGLGRMAREARPLPPAWARVWATTDSAFSRRTPFVRCREYFNELFEARYRERFGDGVVLKPNKTLLRIEYKPASASFSKTAVAETQLPDVAALKEPAGKLRALAEECTEELAPFSRYLGRNPRGAKDLAALALLPPRPSLAIAHRTYSATSRQTGRGRRPWRAASARPTAATRRASAIERPGETGCRSAGANARGGGIRH